MGHVSCLNQSSSQYRSERISPLENMFLRSICFRYGKIFIPFFFPFSFFLFSILRFVSIVATEISFSLLLTARQERSCYDIERLSENILFEEFIFFFQDLNNKFFASYSKIEILCFFLKILAILFNSFIFIAFFLYEFIFLNPHFFFIRFISYKRDLFKSLNIYI